MDRFERQRRLPGVGDAGQRKIGALDVRVRGGEDSLVELLYLHRAGVERVTLSPTELPRAFAHAEAFDDPVCRRLGAAAWRATLPIMGALFGSDP